MKVSGADTAEYCSQVTSAMERLLCCKMAEVIGLIVFDDSNYSCCKEVRKNLILCLCTNEFVSHNPLSLVSAAVVRDFGFASAVVMWSVTVSVTAAGGLRVMAALAPVMQGAGVTYRVTAQGGDCLIGSAVQTCVMNQGKAEAS